MRHNNGTNLLWTTNFWKLYKPKEQVSLALVYTLIHSHIDLVKNLFWVPTVYQMLEGQNHMCLGLCCVHSSLAEIVGWNHLLITDNSRIEGTNLDLQFQSIALTPTKFIIPCM